MNVKLNGQQMLVLQWIAAGAEEATAPVPTYKTSALALQNRGLASGSRRGGTWKASLTDDGAYFLKHGRRPRNQVRSPPPVPHRRRASSPEAAPDPPWQACRQRQGPNHFPQGFDPPIAFRRVDSYLGEHPKAASSHQGDHRPQGTTSSASRSAATRTAYPSCPGHRIAASRMDRQPKPIRSSARSLEWTTTQNRTRARSFLDPRRTPAHGHQTSHEAQARRPRSHPERT